MTPLPAIIYAAKSTADVRGSLPTQIADCEAAIGREGGREIIGPFQDEAASAFKGNRGQGLADAKAAAITAAKEHGRAELWVQHSDRLARGDGLTADHLAEVWFEMRRASVRLRSVQNDSDMESVLYVAIKGEGAHGESKRKSDAVRSGKDRQMARGERMGGPVPDGLRVVVERDAHDRVISRQYVRDDKRAPIIEEMFALSEQGHGDGAIARMLNRRGYRTQAQTLKADSPKTGRKKGDVTPPKEWSRRRVQDTLTNQNYAGRVVRHRGKPNEEVAESSNMVALIDPERFDAMMEARKGRDRSLAGRERARERGKLGGAPTLRYALSRLATCGRCGKTMNCVTSPYKRKDGTQARQYQCPSYRGSTGVCDALPVNAEVVDAAIVPHIRTFFDDFASWAQSVSAASDAERDRLAADLAEAEASLATLSKAQEPAQARYEQVLADDPQGIKAEVALDALVTMKERATEAQARVEALRASLGSLSAESAPSDAMREYWQGLADSIKGRLAEGTAMADVNAELRVVLERVEIDTRPDGRYELRALYKRRGTYEPVTVPVLDADGLIPTEPDESGFVPGEHYETLPIDLSDPSTYTFVPDDHLILTGDPPKRRRRVRERPSPRPAQGSGVSRNRSQLYRFTKPKRGALAASHP